MKERLGWMQSLPVLGLCAGVLAVPAIAQNKATKHPQVKVKALSTTAQEAPKHEVPRQNAERVNRQESARQPVSGDCHALEEQAHQLAAEEKNLLRETETKKHEADALLLRAQEAERERVALLQTDVGTRPPQSSTAQEKEKERVEFHRQSDELEHQREALHQQANEVARQREAIEREHQQRCGRRIEYGEHERAERK